MRNEMRKKVSDLLLAVLSGRSVNYDGKEWIVTSMEVRRDAPLMRGSEIVGFLPKTFSAELLGAKPPHARAIYLAGSLEIDGTLLIADVHYWEESED
jgi:hypothetical protein